MLDVTKKTAIRSRLGVIHTKLQGKITASVAKELIKKDLPWLLGGLEAHHNILRELLMRVWRVKGSRMDDIHNIPPKLVDAGLRLMKPSKAELAGIEEGAKEKTREPRRRKKK